MTSLHKLKRAAESITGKRAVIKYDDHTGAYVEVKSENAIEMTKLDSVCEKTDALMKVEDTNRFGKHRYLFR
jgi:hypothetical protein